MKNDIFNRIKNRLVYEIAPIATLISPKLNTNLLYHNKFGKMLDLREPVTLNEKILWLKFNTYWNNELVKKCADKYRVRGYITERGYEDLLVDLIAVYDDPEKIDWNALPKSFVMKLNIGCGMNLIVHDINELDIQKTMVTIKGWMKQKYWIRHSEMQYKDVKPYILIEKYLGQEDGSLPLDYKFYCMNGKCETILVCEDRIIGKRADYYFMDRSWNILPYTQEALDHPGKIISKPPQMEEAMALAMALAKEFPFVRVDFYIVNGVVYFGELTFTPAGGMDIELKLVPPGAAKDVDTIFGEKLNINI